MGHNMISRISQEVEIATAVVKSFKRALMARPLIELEGNIVSHRRVKLKGQHASRRTVSRGDYCVAFHE